MPKAKRKPSQTPLDKALASMSDDAGRTTAPSQEWLAKHEVEVVQASREGDWTEKQGQTVRALPATHNWVRAQWINAEQAAALEAWARIEAMCAWHTPARDYADMRFGATPGCRPEWLGDVRGLWRGIQAELVEEFEELPVLCLMHWLTTPGTPDYRQAFPHGRNKARTLAAAFIEAVADELCRLLR